MSRVLVSGFYGHQNLGDELFIQAFQSLFPNFHFTFTDKITAQRLEGVDAVFIGGGSFLDQSLKVSDPSILNSLRSHKVFFIGVGAETSIHEDYRSLLPLAKLVAIRTNANYDKMLSLNPNTIVIPDLVYSIPNEFVNAPVQKSILYIPNITTVPDWQSPHWKHAAWGYFKNELAQSLGALIESGYAIDFFPMALHAKQNDRYAAYEIINQMTSGKVKVLEQPNTFNETIRLFSSYPAIITQRYHGAILADIAKVSSLTIHHHDKLKMGPGSHLSFYETSKAKLLSEIACLLEEEGKFLPIKNNMFSSLKERIIEAL